MMDLQFYAFLGAVDSVTSIIRNTPRTNDKQDTPEGFDYSKLLPIDDALKALECVKQALLQAEIPLAKAQWEFRKAVKANSECLYRAMVSIQGTEPYERYLGDQLYRLLEHFAALAKGPGGGEGDGSTSMGSGFVGSGSYPSSSSG
jgi:hypothetical protein